MNTYRSFTTADAIQLHHYINQSKVSRPSSLKRQVTKLYIQTRGLRRSRLYSSASTRTICFPGTITTPTFRLSHSVPPWPIRLSILFVPTVFKVVVVGGGAEVEVVISKESINRYSRVSSNIKFIHASQATHRPCNIRPSDTWTFQNRDR